MMNILDTSLEKYNKHSIMIKNCREVRFSHGGHLFACQSGISNVSVYKFYTAERPDEFFFKCCEDKPTEKPIKSISWLDDDSGFVTCTFDQSVHLWKLYPQTGDNVGRKDDRQL